MSHCNTPYVALTGNSISIQGLRQSPRNFFLHLKERLEAVGLKQQLKVDPCLFISNKVICLVYVVRQVKSQLQFQHYDNKFPNRN